MTSHKEKGNDAFKAGDYATAVGHYTSAMFAEPNIATYPLNRAAAYLKLDKYQDAERDCERVLQLDSENIKGLFRRAQARAGVGKLPEAQADLLKVIKIEPNNAHARQELESIKARIAKVEGKKKAVPPRGPMWKPPSDPMVKPPNKSVTVTSPPVKVSSTTPIPKPTEDGSSPVAKTTTPTRSSSDSQGRGAPVRKRIPIRIIDDEAPGGDKSAPSGIATSNRSIKGSRKIEELHSEATPADPAKAAPKSIAKPSPVSTQAPPEDLSAFLTEISSQPVSESEMKAKARSSSSKAANTSDQRRSQIVRVGGGIWKKDDDNRAVLAERVLERAPPKQLAPGVRGGGEVQSSAGVSNAIRTTVKSAKPPRSSRPATLFELEREWKACEDVDNRWQLLETIPAAEFVGIFKNSLDPPFLTSMLETFKVLLVKDQTPKHVLGQYFNALQRVPRFDTLTLFLSSSEAQILKDVQELLKV